MEFNHPIPSLQSGAYTLCQLAIKYNKNLERIVGVEPT